MLIQMKRMTSIAAVLAAAAMLALAAGCGDEQKPAQADSPAQTAQTKDTEKPAQEKPKEMQVNVYYPRNDGTGLIAVSRKVNTEKDDKYTAAMKSLLTGTKEKGQTNVIPKKAKLRSVTVKDGVATVDFSKELEQNFSGGSTGEEMLIGSIVNTLTDFPEVQKVQILIEGASVETLSGHMDLSEPLTRMTELLH
ncbi:GerMN domain-containing protein [uncultured Selenomonas sp.]|uniref:GerMN domain-containing protein n=1 Tax=uncultured Selenomonas sp. TaxID=159275 RepID=UPI0028E270AD|nr:GerMN domain-containing protein [uncultured Selenomonas sp.]